MSQELREQAERVRAFVAARRLLSNVDPEEIQNVVVMPPGAEEPMEFALLASDLEELARAVLEARCSDRVPDVTGVTASRTCGLTLNADGTCPRPRSEHVS